jgi:hypothetical protein
MTGTMNELEISLIHQNFRNKTRIGCARRSRISLPSPDFATRNQAENNYCCRRKMTTPDGRKDAAMMSVCLSACLPVCLSACRASAANLRRFVARHLFKPYVESLRDGV